MNKTLENVMFLKNRIKDYNDKIAKLQNECSHDIVKGEYKANTGNWCQNDDSYWITAECLDCMKHLLCIHGTPMYDKLRTSGMISSQYDSRSAIESQINKRETIRKQRGYY